MKQITVHSNLQIGMLMGKHKNSITLQFLGLLRERGSIYNFSVEEEYPLTEGVFYADLVYKLPSYDQPIISFEVESSPTSYAIKNAVKYFGTHTSDVPKPWHHFIVILKGMLKPSDRKCLESITEKHNVHIFENVLADEKEQKRFDDEIKEMSKAFREIEESKSLSTEFRIGFSTKVKQCISLIEKNSPETEDAIDELIMLFKERIEKWDVPSVKFATTELFEGLYKLSSKKYLCELYQIFKDLFTYAYSQRKQLIGAMISPFFTILLEAWIKGYDIEKGEQACKVMLRLGIDFLETDLVVSEDCMGAIDNLAGDMFEPEIFSKEIIFCAVAFQKSKSRSGLEHFVEQYSDWIRVNEEYSWDDGKKAYLKDSIRYAKKERAEYGVNLQPYEEEVLIPIICRIADSQIKEYAEFLKEVVDEEGCDTRDISFEVEELTKMIHAYKSYRPNFPMEIQKQIVKTKDKKVITLFKSVVSSSKFLRRIYQS